MKEANADRELQDGEGLNQGPIGKFLGLCAPRSSSRVFSYCQAPDSPFSIGICVIDGAEDGLLTVIEEGGSDQIRLDLVNAVCWRGRNFGLRVRDQMTYIVLVQHQVVGAQF